MKVWWCEVHRSGGTATGCDGLEIVRFFHEPESKCRMVEMRLVSADALVVEKVDGEWQLTPRALLVLSAGNAFSHPEGPIALLNDFADALAEEEEYLERLGGS